MAQDSVDFCAGFGTGHTNKMGNNPYQKINMQKIYELLKSPQQVDKNEALWTTFCTVTNENGRNGEYLKSHGRYVALWLDIDGDVESWEQLKTDVASFSSLSFAYTTASATNNNLRARIIFPLEQPIKFEQYYRCQVYLNSTFNKFGYKVDESNQRPNQLCFLPNNTNGFYLYEVCKGGFFDVHYILSSTPSKTQISKTASPVLPQSNDKPTKEVKNLSSPVLSGNGVIDQFNQEQSLKDLLEKYGYTPMDENRYTSPLAENKTGGVVVDGERWISFHQSDLNSMGRINAEGNNCYGDAFDLYKYFEHGNDTKSAVRALSKIYNK